MNRNIGKAAVKWLERAGYEVIVPNITELGRTQLSKGLVEKAKSLVATNISKLYSFAKQDIPILGLEPSEILTLRDEYLDLCDEESLVKAEKISMHTYQFEEFFAKTV
ncbi:MAG: hypothetical protein U5K69_09855 [Balneolaceae bacterium]|nr:hypothetical protein [Balneolaceae bacterium]